MKQSFAFLLCALLAVSVSGCNAEKNTADQSGKSQDNAAEKSAQSGREPRVALVPFSPGGQKPVVDTSDEGRKIMNDPGQIAAGKQLFAAMNCNGCHFNGGGGIGPPLMDSEWIYGGSIENIAATIREGRPKGMPSFRGFLPEDQIWQVAAYVRSLSQPAPSSASADQQGK